MIPIFEARTKGADFTAQHALSAVYLPLDSEETESPEAAGECGDRCAMLAT